MSGASSNALRRASRIGASWRLRWQLPLLLFAFLFIGSEASAQTNIYHIRGNATAGSNNIWRVDAATGAETLVYSNYPGGNAATIAQRPSDGMLFYCINSAGGSDGPVYRFNPATPGVAPVLLGNLGAAVGAGFRMAFSGANLYFMPAGGGADNNTLYSVNQTTGAATVAATITGTNSGGDMAFNGVTLYIVDQNRNLFTTTAAGGAATALGAINFGGPTPNTIGVAFDAGGGMRLQTVSAAGGQFWSVTGTTATLIGAVGGGTSATGDMASATVPLPNLAITKTDGVTTVYRGGTVTYTIVVTNSGTYAVTGTVADTVPASVTGVTWNCVASAGSSCAAASGAGNAINTSATLLAAGTATYTVSGTISASATGSLVNTATVAVPAWLTDSDTTNNTATDTDTINLNANLGITKTDGLANINPGSAISYTIVVSNAGPDASTGSIVTDTVPATITGVNWTCGSVTGGATCGAASGSGNSINTTANLPSGSSVTYTVTGTLSTTASGTLTNTATVLTPASGVTDPNDPTRTGAGNNTATDNTTINLVPDVRLAKSHSGNFTVGVNGTYTLTASNSGTAATSGTITVVDNLPAGLTIASIPTGTGWNCSTTVVGSSTATCTSATVIAAGATSPNPITLIVVVAPAAFPSVTNSATISGGGEPVTLNGNNSVTDPTTVNGVADLFLAKTHTGNFTVGVNGTYTLTASNSGTLATSGTITVVDNLPAGLTVASIPTGTGWNCSTTVVGSSTATCTSATVIAAGATSPNPITLTVVVAPAAFPSVTNAATISGGGEPAYNNGNNSVTDPTTVNGVADVRLAKSHSGNFTVGVNGTYTLTASNSGTLATSGTITVVDNLPAGLTVASIPTGTGWNCSTTVVGSSTATCTSSTVIAAGATSPNPITLTVVVAPAAFPSVTNAATISGGGEPAYNNGNNSVTDPTTVNGVADVRIAKSHSGNFTVGVNGTYTLTASNSGTLATSGTITVVDNLPGGLTVASIPTGTGWNCSTTVIGSNTATCTSSTAIAAGATSPNPITVTVVVAAAAFPTVTNAATISGGGEPAYNNGNNSATDPTTVIVSDLTIVKTHVGNFTQGQVGATYSITATNSGTASTIGTVTVTDTLPTGLTATAISGTGWSCVLGTLTCTRSDALAAGSSYPVITLTVTVANNAPASVTNSVSVSGGGQINTANDTATNPTTINQLPDLTISKSHVGNFTQGQVGATYSITATNSGSAATSGTVTVVDTLPTGLTATAISGTGWSCVLGTLTCTRSDALAAASSYPVITVTVTVANNAPASVTNSATVSGGGESNASNNTANDPTTINQLPDMTISKSHVGNFTQGQVGATYSITATNSGSAATSGTVTVVDTLPTGLTATAISGTGWSCVLGTLTCTRSDVLAAGASYPVITVTVTVANNAPASVTNSVTVSGGGQTNTTNDTATNPTTINQLPDLTITKSHVGNFTQGQVGATYSITATNSGAAATSGTVTVVDTLPSGLTATAISGTGWSCVLGTLTCTRSDALAAGSSYPVITVTVTVANNAPASVTNSVSVSGGGQTNTGNDSATDPTTINQLPDMTISKSHVGNFTQGQVGATYSITATNSGSAATSGTVTVVDTLPSGLTATAISGTGWSCVLGTLTCTRSDGLAAGSSYPVITVTVNVANNAPASVTNSATVSGGGQTNTGNDSATDPTTINQLPDLTISKSHVGNFTQGQVGATYSITATNSGSAATSGTVTVVDTLPAGLTATAISGTGWSCVLGTLTCTRSDALAAGSSYPVITVTVTVANNAPASVTNSVTVSGGGQTNTGNDSATDPTTINGVADLRLAKSHGGNFTVGVNGTYTLTASNSGTGATSGTITVIDNLPAGLTIASIPTGTGWNCSTTVVGSSTATCTSSTVIAGGATSPNPITVTVVVAPAAFPSVINAATISGGGEPAFNNGNNSATDPTTVNGVSDVRIAKSHSGNFTVGVNGTYTLTASNSGTLATSGTITVIDNLPAGLTVASIPTGTGWNCSTTVVGSNTATCTSSTVIAAGATSPNPITLTVVVAPAAFPSVTNAATISGGGEPAYNNGNNSTTDPTTVNGISDLTIAKSHTGNFTQGQTGATYSVTVTNSGTAATSGTVTVVDTLPSGLTATAISGAGWSCVLGTLTCTRSDALAVGASYPVITLTVNVSLSAPASVTNTATVSGGGENNATNNTANDPTTINTAAPPSVGLVKSVSPGGTQIPGTDLLYTIVYTNTGGQPANSLIIVDPNPANAVPAERVFNNVDFKIGSLTSSPGSTGLVATFQYSNDGGTTWTYTPVSGGGGAPAGYDRLVTNVRWSFVGSLSQTAPNNTGSVTLTVRIR